MKFTPLILAAVFSAAAPVAAQTYNAVEGWAKFADGKAAGATHGMVIHAEPDSEYIYLEGNQIWVIGWPEETGLHENKGRYKPLDGEFMDIIATKLNRPRSVSIHNGMVAVAELAGSVTALNRENEVHAHIGQNPAPKLRASFGAPPEAWKRGAFTAPHSVEFDAQGTLSLQDWNKTSRITKLAVSK